MSFSTPNLPSKNFDLTVKFYEKLGFQVKWHDDGWLILKRDTVMLEFFPDPEVDPLTSGSSCCLRLENLDEFYSVCLNAGIPESMKGAPRLHKPALEDSGLRIGALIDPDGTLLRLIQN